MTDTPAREEYGIPATPLESGIPTIKPEDAVYFAKLKDDVDESLVSSACFCNTRMSSAASSGASVTA